MIHKFFRKKISRKQLKDEIPNYELHENDIKILKQLKIDLFLTTQEIQTLIFPDISMKLIENGVNNLYQVGYLGRVTRENKYAYFLEDKGEEVLESE